ncbi:MAG: TonB-dependent receptor [Gallionellaceae bacterium]|nr:TonB-dependent receptor [Gallionellaceae bacterium]
MVTRVFLGLLAALIAQAGQAEELSEAAFLVDLPVVLTASRLSQPLMDAPTAMTVIDRPMIEASGFREIADLFRLVPGFYAAYFSGNQPFVSNALISEYARSMQVLVDGRSVYLPTIGGVLWSALPLSMEDIERIEVTRGPNAASYGANAFTGVINIISRHPQDVAGHMVKLASGDKGVRIGTYRWAGGEQVKNRVTLEYRHDDGFDGQNDYLQAPLFNYRGEYEADGWDSLSWQLGYVGGDRGAGYWEEKLDQPHNKVINSHFQQIDWTRRIPGMGELKLGLYHNYTLVRETATNALFPYKIGGTYYPVPAGQSINKDLMADRWNIEVQHTLEPMGGTRAVWGASLRQDAVQSRFYFGSDDELNNHSGTLFGHLEQRFSPHWLLNAGVMLEKHDIGGASTSPRVSLHWQPSVDHAFRLSLSQAKRYPVQYEENALSVLTLNVSLPFPFGLTPISATLYRSSGGLRPESIRSSEIGYVGSYPGIHASIEARLFRWQFTDLIQARQVATVYDFFNRYSATLQGGDMQVKWEPSERTRVIANFAYLHTEGNNVDFAASAPMHQAGLLLSQRLPGNVMASMGYYWTGDFVGLGEGDPLNSSRRMDLKLSMPIKTEGMKGDVSLVMQNLTDDYLEFYRRNLFTRRGYIQLKLDF